MSLPLLPAILVLLGVLAACPFVLAHDSRQRRMQRHFALVLADGAQGPLEPELVSIRRERPRFHQLRAVSRAALMFDPEARDVYVLSAPLTFAIGLLAGAVAMASCAKLMPLDLSLGTAAIVAALTWRGLFSWQHRRYSRLLSRQLPDALQFIATAVASGFPVLEAFRGAARESPEPTHTAFAGILDTVALGRPLQDAVLDLYQRTNVAEYAIMGVTIGVQAKTGGHLAGTIQTLAETVRDRLALAARAKALAGEATASAAILSVLPIIAGIALSIIQPGYLDPLFHDPRGRRLFWIAVFALLAGIWTMRRMIAGVTKEW